MNLLRTIAVATALVAAAPAVATPPPPPLTNFSFAGTLPNANSVKFFDFTVASTSTVTLRSWSYAGGVNAAGTSITSGGFDPMLTLFAMPSGAYVYDQDDADDDGEIVPVDLSTGNAYDVLLPILLGPGDYRVALTAYDNAAEGDLADGFSGDGDFDGRTNAFAFDILNVSSVTDVPVAAVPEPASWAMLIAGFGLIGATLRRRRALALA